jgi:hypothetical protein
MRSPSVPRAFRLLLAILLWFGAESIATPPPAEANACCDPGHSCPVRLPSCVDADGAALEFVVVTTPGGRTIPAAADAPVILPDTKTPQLAAPPRGPHRDRAVPPDRGARATPAWLGRFLL